jgi:hypothetical protein
MYGVMYVLERSRNTAAFQESFDYMEKVAPKPSGILDIEELVKENNKMREYSKLIATEFKKSSRVT